MTAQGHAGIFARDNEVSQNSNPFILELYHIRERPTVVTSNAYPSRRAWIEARLIVGKTTSETERPASYDLPDAEVDPPERRAEGPEVGRTQAIEEAVAAVAKRLGRRDRSLSGRERGRIRRT